LRLNKGFSFNTIRSYFIQVDRPWFMLRDLRFSEECCAFRQLTINHLIRNNILSGDVIQENNDLMIFTPSRDAPYHWTRSQFLPLKFLTSGSTRMSLVSHCCTAILSLQDTLCKQNCCGVCLSLIDSSASSIAPSTVHPCSFATIIVLEVQNARRRALQGQNIAPKL
jgi:hypothetical protein